MQGSLRHHGRGQDGALLRIPGMLSSSSATQESFFLIAILLTVQATSLN